MNTNPAPIPPNPTGRQIIDYAAFEFSLDPKDVPSVLCIPEFKIALTASARAHLEKHIHSILDAAKEEKGITYRIFKRPPVDPTDEDEITPDGVIINIGRFTIVRARVYDSPKLFVEIWVEAARRFAWDHSVEYPELGAYIGREWQGRWPGQWV
jgi:hypothetical protein